MHTTPPLVLDEALAQDISRAVINAIGKTFSIEVKAAPYEIGEGIVSLVGDVSGVIAMVQNHIEGTLAVCMSNEALLALLPGVVGPSVNITQEMASDAVGEITNMVFGQIKRDMGERGFQLKLGIPCVVMGKGHFVSQFHRGQYMIVPFHLNGHLMQVYIAANYIARP
jgi:CheY-specific phosphatase CheX